MIMTTTQFRLTDSDIVQELSRLGQVTGMWSNNVGAVTRSNLIIIELLQRLLEKQPCQKSNFMQTISPQY